MKLKGYQPKVEGVMLFGEGSGAKHYHLTELTEYRVTLRL